jgi:hypothetical protein
MQALSDRHATQIFGLAMGAVFCRYSDLECGFLLKRAWPMISTPNRPSALVSGSQQPRSRTLAMKTERFAGHSEAREALVLSVASVTALTLTAYLILLILY